MSLIKCNECGNEVSSLAAACPKCGAPVLKEQVNQFVAPDTTYVSQSQSEESKLKKINLNIPDKKPMLEEPFTVGTGLTSGCLFGFLILVLMGIFGGFSTLLLLGNPLFILVILVVSMVIGLFIALSDKGKPAKEKAQSFNISFPCPYCQKTFSYSHKGPITSLAADVKSLKCSVCGNISIIDWEIPEKNSR